ncbi:hypothetical protein BG418_16565 [Streptomyces sp. CBMA152]|nr:hypothetical protein [Streptomyces sp. CBMA152]
MAMVMSSSFESRSMSAIARAGRPSAGQRASHRPPGATIPDGTVSENGARHCAHAVPALVQPLDDVDGDDEH